MPSRAPQEVLNIAKAVGSLVQHWGFKKIHGQIWTLIFLSKNPLNSTVLTRRLQVSKALVSLAIKDLLRYRAIEIIEKKNKEIYFRSNPRIFQVIRDVLESREKLMLAETQKTYGVLKSSLPIDKTNFDVDPEKLAELGQMFEAADGMLSWLMSSCSDDKIAT